MVSTVKVNAKDVAINVKMVVRIAVMILVMLHVLMKLLLRHILILVQDVALLVKVVQKPQNSVLRQVARDYVGVLVALSVILLVLEFALAIVTPRV